MVERYVIEKPLCVEILRSGWCEAMSNIWMVPDAVPTNSKEDVREMVREVMASL